MMEIKGETKLKCKEKVVIMKESRMMYKVGQKTMNNGKINLKMREALFNKNNRLRIKMRSR